MNPLTYLGFTIFSIIMQFCVMEFINERFQVDSANSNESTGKSNVITDINRKPHALFYRTEIDKTAFETHNKESIKYSNASLEDKTFLTTTDISSTAFEVYYENSSLMDDFFTTESYSTSSEFDNVTEISYLDKNITTTVKPSVTNRVANKENCFCNLLYKRCDINCCCDTDCTDEERSLFINCKGDGCSKIKGINFCNSHPTCRHIMSTEVFNDLFCVVRVNLPEKRIKSHFKLDEAALNATYKWNTIKNYDTSLHFKKNKYQYGDPLWLLKNGVISPLTLPTTVTNYYCNGKKQLSFLINESIKCYVKLKDLYMFSALKTLEGTNLISVTELSMNSTALNCSTLHCTNWTIQACNKNICDDFNSTMHVPICEDNYCRNVARTMEYTFYYSESKIINASLKLYFIEIPMHMPLLVQTITVNWYFGNESIEDIIQLSGNPGYIPGLPVIISPATANHTSNFYNQTYGTSYLPFPRNVNGRCDWLSLNNNTLLFGLNARLKCRMNFIKNISLKNATRSCESIQINIKERLRLNQMLFISPYGNPREMKDDHWVPLQVDDRGLLYGEYRSKNSKLLCNNLATRYAFVIAYADTSGAVDKEENKIVKATVGATLLNITFDLAEITTVLTIDVRFIDISKPIIEFAKTPNLNIQLPTNFFFDDSSNGYHHTGGVMLGLNCCIFLLMTK